MKSNKLIIWAYLAVTIIINYNCLATESRISQRREEIEHSFMNRIFESQLRTASEIRLLEVAEKSKPNWADIAEWADFAETVLQINGCEHESFSLAKITAETPAERLAVALSRIAKRKSDLLNRSKFETLNLENQKEYTLSTELAELEKPVSEKERNPKSRATHGMVIGIVYSHDKSSAVVNNQIVHEGDILRGVAVVKINKNNVVFEKNGNKWEQAVRQTPDASWK